jgi:hypothetical protein
MSIYFNTSLVSPTILGISVTSTFDGMISCYFGGGTIIVSLGLIGKFSGMISCYFGGCAIIGSGSLSFIGNTGG